MLLSGRDGSNLVHWHGCAVKGDIRMFQMDFIISHQQTLEILVDTVDTVDAVDIIVIW
jgi:hypothetical protein